MNEQRARKTKFSRRYAEFQMPEVYVMGTSNRQKRGWMYGTGSYQDLERG